MKAYHPQTLPLPISAIDYQVFLPELLEATARLEVYKEKIIDSKVDSSWFMPTLQQKEALASTKLEGTQATLDGVLLNQIDPKGNDTYLNEVDNYFEATILGLNLLKRDEFSDDLLCSLHKALLEGNVRKREGSLIGNYRAGQNYVGLTGDMHAITYTPPPAEEVPVLMKNLIAYMNHPGDTLQPLIRTAIVHAQMETIHPFDDGNGRIGRILIPLYLYQKEQISLPCFFISEALESDKFKYYALLNETRTKQNWNDWIKFFLQTVAKQCSKYIYIIAKINALYETHREQAKELVNTSNMVDVIDTIYQHPVLDAALVEKETQLSLATVNRYLNLLVKGKILYSDGKQRHRKFFCYDLLSVLRI